eukprot:gene7932-1146_t
MVSMISIHASAVFLLVLAAASLQPTYAVRLGSQKNRKLSQTDTIVSVASGDDTLSTLVMAVAASPTILAAANDTTTTFTVFAPTNAAFTEALIALDLTDDELLADVELLTQILSYHIITSVVPSSDITTSPTTVKTFLGSSLTATLIDGQVFINDAMVTTADVEAGLSIVHIIDKVLIPPTIVSVASGVDVLSTLVEAVKASPTILAAATNYASAVTVFAPTNAAFTDALDALDMTADQLLADTELLTQILSYHIVPSVIMSSAITASTTTVETLSGDSINATLIDGTVYINDAMVTTADVDAGLSVVHVINRVLIPPEISLPTIASVASSVSDLSILVDAVMASPTVLAAASNPNTAVTVFAPTNAAFATALAALNMSAAQLLADTQLLTRILEYHIVPSIVPSSAATSTTIQVATLLANNRLNISLVNGSVMVNDAEVVEADVDAGRSLVHVIDKVLIPLAQAMTPPPPPSAAAALVPGMRTLLAIVVASSLILLAFLLTTPKSAEHLFSASKPCQLADCTPGLLQRSLAKAARSHMLLLPLALLCFFGSNHADAAFLEGELSLRPVLTNPMEIIIEDAASTVMLSGRQAITVVYSRPVIALGSDFATAVNAGGKNVIGQTAVSRPVIALGSDFAMADNAGGKIPFTLTCPLIPGKFRWVTTTIARWDVDVDWPTDLNCSLQWNDTLTSYDGMTVDLADIPSLRKFGANKLSMSRSTVLSDRAENVTGGMWDGLTGTPDDKLPEVPPDGRIVLKFNYPVKLNLLRDALVLSDRDSYIPITVRPCNTPSPWLQHDEVVAILPPDELEAESMCAEVIVLGELARGVQLELPEGAIYNPISGRVANAQSTTIYGLRSFRLFFKAFSKLSKKTDYLMDGVRYNRLDCWLPHGLSKDSPVEELKSVIRLCEVFKPFGKSSESRPLDFSISLTNKATTRLDVPGFGLKLKRSETSFWTYELSPFINTPKASPSDLISEAGLGKAPLVWPFLTRMEKPKSNADFGNPVVVEAAAWKLDLRNDRDIRLLLKTIFWEYYYNVADVYGTPVSGDIKVVIQNTIYAAFTITPLGMTAWVTSALPGGGPVEGAVARIYENTYAQMEPILMTSCSTNAEGVCSNPMSATAGYFRLVGVVTKENDVAVVPDLTWYTSTTPYPYVGTIVLDRAVVKPGDEIHSGSFHIAIPIPPTASPVSSYLTVLLNWDILARTSFTIANPRPPTADLELSLPAWTLPNSNIAVVVQATSYIGIAVGGMPMMMTWRSPRVQGIKTINMEADGSGTATIYLSAWTGLNETTAGDIVFVQ